MRRHNKSTVWLTRAAESSLCDSNSEYVPVLSLTESEEEEQGTTSSILPLHERPGTSGVWHQPQRVRARCTCKPGMASPLTQKQLIYTLLLHSQVFRPKQKTLHTIFTNYLSCLIVDQCNLYAPQFFTNNPNSSYARPYEWKPLTVEQFKIFFGLTVKIGLRKKNELHSYWSTNPICHMAIY